MFSSITFVVHTLPAEFLISEDGGQNIIISDAFIKGRNSALPHSLLSGDSTELFLFLSCYLCPRVSVQPSCGGEGQRNAVHSAGLAPQLSGSAQRGERGEDGHGEAAVSGELSVSVVHDCCEKLGFKSGFLVSLVPSCSCGL